MASPLIIITGPSGSGKGTFLRALEDRGYFCVDNLPVDLLPKFSELLVKSDADVERAALVVDVRERQGLFGFPAAYQSLKATPGLSVSLYFLEASDESLIRRFSETRRPHPLDSTLPVRDAIQMERDRLWPIRAMADHVLDTSHFSIHDLRNYTNQLHEVEEAPLLVSLVSFGYKYGIPVDADMIFDVRFMPNPFFVPELRELTGLDSPVVEYMRRQEVTAGFLDRLNSLLEFLLPQFEREGKSYLTIAVGCTGGRHRSVMIVNALAAAFETSPGRRLKVIHRDVEK